MPFRLRFASLRSKTSATALQNNCKGCRVSASGGVPAEGSLSSTLNVSDLLRMLPLLLPGSTAAAHTCDSKKLATRANVECVEGASEPVADSVALFMPRSCMPLTRPEDARLSMGYSNALAFTAGTQGRKVPLIHCQDKREKLTTMYRCYASLHYMDLFQGSDGAGMCRCHPVPLVNFYPWKAAKSRREKLEDVLSEHALGRLQLQQSRVLQRRGGRVRGRRSP